MPKEIDIQNFKIEVFEYYIFIQIFLTTINFFMQKKSQKNLRDVGDYQLLYEI
jgi:hypothetical protein